MLSAKFRINKKVDFDKIFAEGKTAFFGQLMLKSTPNNLGFSRFGFVVSKKLSKYATKRNLVKRLLREAVRKSTPSVKEGFDVIIYATKALPEKKPSLLEISRIVNVLLKQNNLLKKQ